MRILAIDPKKYRVNSAGRVYDRRGGGPCIEATCPVCKERFWARRRSRKTNPAKHQIFCSRICLYKSGNLRHKPPVKIGAENNMWRGGRYLSRGYVYIKCPSHPLASNGGYVPEHWLVVEKALGRHLKKGERVHHLNGRKADNRPINLVVCTESFHQWIEHKLASLYKELVFGGI